MQPTERCANFAANRDVPSLPGGLVDSPRRLSTDPADVLPDRTAGLCNGYMLTPMPPVDPISVIREFSPAAHDWLAAHRGVDLVARPGQAVVAPLSGEVAFVGKVAGRSVIAIRTPVARFTLEPVTSRLAAGEQVRSGERIGRVSTGGHCDRRCIHWGAKVGGQYIDPMSMLKWRAPVLKPIGLTFRASTVRSEPDARASPAAPCCGSGSRDSP